MKKRIIAVITTCACVLTFAACQKKPTNDEYTDSNKDNVITDDGQNNENTPEPAYTIKTEPLTDTVSLKDTGELLFTKTVERVRVTAQHEAYVDAAKSIASVMKTASERNEKQADELKNSIFSAYTGEDMTGLPWALDAKYEVTSDSGKFVCILEHIYHNAGGAYPTYADFAYNFDAETGTQLFLSDFFPIDDDVQTPKIDSMLKAKLDEKYPDTVQESFIQTNLIDMATDTWCFTENGIKVWYNEQEIAPHAAGKLEIELTRDELPESALAYLD